MFILYFILLTFSGTFQAESNSECAWSEGVYPYVSSSSEIPFEKKTESFTADNKLKINVTSSYPVFQNKSLFFKSVHNYLQSNAQEEFARWVMQFTEEEKEICELDEEAISMDFDKRDFAYVLTPTYSSDNLVSIFGELYKFDGMPHGSTRYYAFTYWFNGKELQNLNLESLFLPEKNFTNFILGYCESTLQKEKVGYRDDLFPEFEESNLQVFSITKKGLVFTFQPYHVGGWADGPYSITIPFDKLAPFINPLGPLRELM